MTSTKLVNPVKKDKIVQELLSDLETIHSELDSLAKESETIRKKGINELFKAGNKFKELKKWCEQKGIRFSEFIVNETGYERTYAQRIILISDSFLTKPEYLQYLNPSWRWMYEASKLTEAEFIDHTRSGNITIDSPRRKFEEIRKGITHEPSRLSTLSQKQTQQEKLKQTLKEEALQQAKQELREERNRLLAQQELEKQQIQDERSEILAQADLSLQQAQEQAAHILKQAREKAEQKQKTLISKSIEPKKKLYENKVKKQVEQEAKLYAEELKQKAQQQAIQEESKLQSEYDRKKAELDKQIAAKQDEIASLDFQKDVKETVTKEKQRQQKWEKQGLADPEDAVYEKPNLKTSTIEQRLEWALKFKHAFHSLEHGTGLYILGIQGHASNETISVLINRFSSKFHESKPTANSEYLKLINECKSEML